LSGQKAAAFVFVPCVEDSEEDGMKRESRACKSLQWHPGSVLRPLTIKTYQQQESFFQYGTKEQRG
jgi:hypothetical protein